MKRLSSVFLATLGLTVGTHSFAQAQTASAAGENLWTLQQAVEHAAKNNLQVRQVNLSVEQATLNVSQSRANQLPTLNGNGSHGFSNGFFFDPISNQNQNTQGWTGNIGLQSSVNLYNGFQVKNNIKRNQLDQQASQLDLQKAKNDIILAVVTSYIHILLNQELLKTNQERLNLTQSQLDRTQKLFKAGSVPESNVMELIAQMSSDELNIIIAQNQIELAELRLIQLLNLDNASPATFAIVIPELEDPDQSIIGFNAEQVYNTAESVMPEIRRAQIRMESALSSVEIAKGAYQPNLALVGNINTRYSSNATRLLFGEFETIDRVVGFVNNDITQRVTMPTPFRSSTPRDYPYFTQLGNNIGQYIGLSLNIPILNGFRVRNNVQLSKIALRNAELNTAIAKNDLKQNIAQAYTDAVGAQRRFVAAKKQLEAFQQAFSNSEIRLNNGLINNVDYNVARNNLVKAQSDIIQAKFDYIFKLKILEFYQGKTITL